MVLFHEKYRFRVAQKNSHATETVYAAPSAGGAASASRFQLTRGVRLIITPKFGLVLELIEQANKQTLPSLQVRHSNISTLAAVAVAPFVALVRQRDGGLE